MLLLLLRDLTVRKVLLYWDALPRELRLHRVAFEASGRESGPTPLLLRLHLWFVTNAAGGAAPERRRAETGHASQSLTPTQCPEPLRRFPRTHRLRRILGLRPLLLLPRTVQLSHARLHPILAAQEGATSSPTCVLLTRALALRLVSHQSSLVLAALRLPPPLHRHFAVHFTAQRPSLAHHALLVQPVQFAFTSAFSASYY